jgi:hypothetical protein
LITQHSTGRGGTGNIKNAAGLSNVDLPSDPGTRELAVGVPSKVCLHIIRICCSAETHAAEQSGRGGSGNFHQKPKPLPAQTAAIMSQYLPASQNYERELMAASAAKRKATVVRIVP